MISYPVQRDLKGNEARLRYPFSHSLVVGPSERGLIQLSCIDSHDKGKKKGLFTTSVKLLTLNVPIRNIILLLLLVLRHSLCICNFTTGPSVSLDDLKSNPTIISMLTSTRLHLVRLILQTATSTFAKIAVDVDNTEQASFRAVTSKSQH